MLPVAVINPAVRKFPPSMLPVALTVVPDVTAPNKGPLNPVEVMLPDALIRPMLTLPVPLGVSTMLALAVVV